MKFFVAFFFLVMFFNQAFAQIENGDDKLVTTFLEDLPKRLKDLNLEDLRYSKDTLSIRIWNQGITNLNSTNPNYQLCIGGKERTCKVFKILDSTSKVLMDVIISLNPFNLKNDSYRGIDGSIVVIEILHKGNYKVFSYWSPDAKRNESNKNVINMLNAVSQKLSSNNYTDQLFQSLKPGEYSWGMSSIYIDHFLTNDVKKTDFYLVVKNRMKLELNVDENSSVTRFPLIFINNSIAQISDLNRYSNKDLIDCKILKPDMANTALYGGRAIYGVIMVKTR